MGVVRLAVANDQPVSKGCANCRWLEKDRWPRIPELDQCGKFKSSARSAVHGLCGPQFSGWQLAPPPKGLIPALRDRLFGARQ